MKPLLLTLLFTIFIAGAFVLGQSRGVQSSQVAINLCRDSVNAAIKKNLAFRRTNDSLKLVVDSLNGKLYQLYNQPERRRKSIKQRD